MSATRLFGLSLVLAAASACAPPSGTQAPRPIKPEDGPKGSIRASYNGGLAFRSLEAYFRVDGPAYVIVGHLGGDGVIRVLYPKSPRQYRIEPANRTLRTGFFTAYYDGAPSLFRFVMPAFRGLGAEMDSYDGRGHGYVFMIATRSRAYVDAISDGHDWDEIDVEQYDRTHDPRLAIRDFADMVTEGVPYTLKFANSFNTQGYQSYAGMALDCSLLSSLGYGGGHSFWGSWGLGGLSWLGHSSLSSLSPYSVFSGCGRRSYADYYQPRRQYVYIPRTSEPTQPPAPTGPITPILTRPTQRAFAQATRGVLMARSTLDRREAPGNSGLQRRGPSQRDDSFGRRPSRADADRPSARPSARPVDEPRFSTPRGESPRSTDPSPRSSGSGPRTAAPTPETPRHANPPQRSTPPTPTKPTEVKPQ